MPIGIQGAGVVPARHFVRERIKEKGGNPLLVIDAEVVNTRED